MSSIRTRVNKYQLTKTRCNTWIEQKSKQQNHNIFKINQFNRQSIIELFYVLPMLHNVMYNYKNTLLLMSNYSYIYIHVLSYFNYHPIKNYTFVRRNLVEL